MRRSFLIIGLLFVLLMVAGFLIQPYLAVTAPVASDVAVVEGWIPDDMMSKVKREIEERHYGRIYTTGTVRPFSYYLRTGEGIEVAFDPPQDGGIRINVSGIVGAGFMLLADGDTLLNRSVSGVATDYFTNSKKPIAGMLLIATNTGTPAEDLEDIYVKEFTLSGTNVHNSAKSTRFVAPSGERSDAWPTYAHYAAARLAQEGIPKEHIHVAPASDRMDSRTLANAVGFADRAAVDDIKRFNVISVGIHARRSRKMYRRACPPGSDVGIIALPDPQVSATNWWRTRHGRMRMLKELAGLPVSSMFGAEQ